VYSAQARVPANLVATITDSSAGNIKDGRRRQVVVAGLAPRKQHWYSVSCTNVVAIGDWQTLAAGSGTYQFTHSPKALVYSANPDMSSATSVNDGIVPVPAGGVAYVRSSVGGPITALVAP
jgi:hypothetical protein